MDSLHGWESRNLDLMSSTKCIKRGLSLEWFRTNQIRMAKKIFADRGGGCIEWLLLQRIWRTERGPEQMMRDNLRHVNPFWRDQRSTSARLLDPRNQNEMKRRRVGVAHTTWDNFMTKGSGCQRWWDSCKGWESFVRAAEEVCKRAPKREENKVTVLE